MFDEYFISLSSAHACFMWSFNISLSMEELYTPYFLYSTGYEINSTFAHLFTGLNLFYIKYNGCLKNMVKAIFNKNIKSVFFNFRLFAYQTNCIFDDRKYKKV